METHASAPNINGLQGFLNECVTKKLGRSSQAEIYKDSFTRDESGGLIVSLNFT